MILLYLLICTVLFTGIAILGLRYWYLKKEVDEIIRDKVIFQVAVPVNNDKTPLAAEQFFQSLHGILRNSKKSQHHFSFELIATEKAIYFVVVCNQRYEQFLQNQIYAQYPSAQISTIQDFTTTADKLHPGEQFMHSELTLNREYYLPIRTFISFEVDPLASITAAISKIPTGHQAWIQILFRPIDNSWQKQGKAYVDTLKNKTDTEGNKVGLESGESAEIMEIEKKSKKVGFQFCIRIITKGPDQILNERILDDIEASFKQFQTAHLNNLVPRSDKSGLFVELRKLLIGQRLNDKLSVYDKFHYRFLNERTKDIINIEELASIYHLPSKSVETPNISWAKSRKLESPNNVPTHDARIFALTDYRNQHIPFGLKDQDRKRHMYILGKTGSGKSTLLKNMIVADIIDGKGLAVLDPHGDLVEDVLDLIPPERAKDVIYLDPSDMEYPIGLNVLDIKENETMELLADGIVSVFKKYFGNSWGPRLQYILTNVILTLLQCQNVSLLAVQRVLVDSNYRKFLLKQVRDPFLIQFWHKEFDEMSKNPRLLTEAVSPIQNKVGRFLNSRMVRNMFGQIKSTINLEEVMNEGKILLVNLSQGKIGEENSSLLGGMIVTRLYTNAMQRANMPESQRRDFYLYVDEFQNFATDTFVKILSEARKYGMNLIVTHQYIDQIEEDIQKAIFGNVGTLVNFVVGQRDAHFLEKEYEPALTAEDLVNLGKFRLVMKMMVDGAQTQPFTAISLPPSFKTYGHKQEIKQFSREQYASQREDVESKLEKWSRQVYDDKGNLIQQRGS